VEASRSGWVGKSGQRAGKLPALAIPLQLTTVPAMNDDKILQFPGAGKTAKAAPPAPTDNSTVMPPGLEGLNEDQRKALQVVLSGMTFVLVGIKPTDRGADFFTSVHGASELRNACDHLPGVIERAFDRKGI